MGFLADFLSGIKTLEEVVSPINGKLTVVQDFIWGVHIQGGGLTQSGGVAEKVWRMSLKEVKAKNTNIKSVLILGLGGGSIAKISSEFWPEAKVNGVDIDPVIVSLGEKYLGLDTKRVKTQIGDAEEYVKNAVKKKHHFDLICLDTYVQDNFPEKFEAVEFLENIKAILNEDGIAVFNRLFYGEKRKFAYKFQNNLEKIFKRVDAVYPEANVMYIAS